VVVALVWELLVPSSGSRLCVWSSAQQNPESANRQAVSATFPPLPTNHRRTQPNRYASYKLVQQMPGGEKLTGFTRILHRTTDDAVVGEVRWGVGCVGC